MKYKALHLVVFLVVLFSLTFVTTVHAQVTLTPTVVQKAGCEILTRALSYGMSDQSASSQVLLLQKFLASKNYMVNNLVTGFFGTITRNAVKQYQHDHSIDTTGSVGPLTRGAINSQNCGVTTQNQPIVTGPYLPATTTIPTYYNKSVSISRLSASSGAVGETITIFGSGFESLDNTIILGNAAVSGVFSTTTKTLSFEIPQPAPACPTYSDQGCTLSDQYVQSKNGQYLMYVTNTHGISNGVWLKITTADTSTNTRAPSITAISGPTTLSLGTQGIWTLVVGDQYQRSLTASIKWGDDKLNPSGALSSKTFFSQKQNILTFTHTYPATGRYTPTVTVSDDDNVALKSSAGAYAVTIASSYAPNTNKPTLSRIVPSSGVVGTTVTLQGSGFTKDGNTVYFGTGVIRNVPSYNNGSTVFFDVPSYINPCDGILTGSCNASTIQISPGSYPVFVLNSIGAQTTSANFSVSK